MGPMIVATDLIAVKYLVSAGIITGLFRAVAKNNYQIYFIL